MPTHRPRRTPRLPALLGGFALALCWLLWQGYAHGHRVVHAPGLAAPVAHAHQHEHHHDHPHGHAHPGMADFFGGHSDATDCRLLDASGHSDAVPAVPALCLPVLLTSWALHRFTGEATARWAALFDARGPPRFR